MKKEANIFYHGDLACMAVWPFITETKRINEDEFMRVDIFSRKGILTILSCLPFKKWVYSKKKEFPPKGVDPF